jgi:hypothetical protein
MKRLFLVTILATTLGMVAPALFGDTIDFSKRYSSYNSSSYSFVTFKELTDGSLQVTISTTPKDQVFLCQKDKTSGSYTVVKHNNLPVTGTLIIEEFSESKSYGGGTWVNGYTRKNGTRVKGYWRGGAPRTVTVNGFNITVSLNSSTLYYRFQL